MFTRKILLSPLPTLQGHKTWQLIQRNSKTNQLKGHHDTRKQKKKGQGTRKPKKKLKRQLLPSGTWRRVSPGKNLKEEPTTALKKALENIKEKEKGGVLRKKRRSTKSGSDHELEDPELDGKKRKKRKKKKESGAEESSEEETAVKTKKKGK